MATQRRNAVGVFRVCRPIMLVSSCLCLLMLTVPGAMGFYSLADLPDHQCGPFYYLTAGAEQGELVRCEFPDGICLTHASLPGGVRDFVYIPSSNVLVYATQDNVYKMDAETGDSLYTGNVGSNKALAGLEVDTQLDRLYFQTYDLVLTRTLYYAMNTNFQLTWISYVDGFTTGDVSFTFDGYTRSLYTVIGNDVVRANLSEPGELAFNQSLITMDGYYIEYMKAYRGTLYYLRSDNDYDVYRYCPEGECEKLGTDVEYNLSFGFYGHYLVSPQPGDDGSVQAIVFDSTTGEYLIDLPISITGPGADRGLSETPFIREAFFAGDECPGLVDEEEGVADVSVMLGPIRLSQRNSYPIVLTVNHPSPIVASSFHRTADTGRGLDDPAGITEVDTGDQTIITLNADSAHSRESRGVFTHEFSSSGGAVMHVYTVVQWTGTLHFTKPTQTAYVGDTIILTTGLSHGRRRRWRLNGVLLHQYNNVVTLEISSVDASHAGIWETHLGRAHIEGKHAIMRLIVNPCPRMLHNAPACDQTTYRECFNGGYLKYNEDACMCAPGFKGENCETSYGAGKYGQNGQYDCPNQDLDNPCAGVLICQQDPGGCSCGAGLKGVDCDEACDADTYGAGCDGTCHCATSEPCDPVTGVCPGGCVIGWEGINCQIED